MNYEFSQGNRIKIPHTYMYTKYYGKDFLKAYFASRRDFLKGTGEDSKKELIQSGDRNINVLRSRINGRKNTSTGLCLLILEILNGNNAGTYERLSAFVKNYERTKKLYGAYDKNLRPVSKDYSEITPYVLLALACGVYYTKNGNLKFLNCLLKLDDAIISCADKIKNSKLKRLADIAIKFELTAVENLIEKSGVTI